MSTRAETPLPSLLQIIETSLTVVYLGETDLQYVEPGWSIVRARAFLEEHEFDVAPVRDRRPHLLVTLDELQGDDGTVPDAARPIDASHLVTEGLGMADAIELLREHPWYFVMERDALVGIVTRADFQRPAVGMVTFSLVLAAEAAMNRIIEGSLGPGWPDALGEEARGEVEKLFEDRRRTNTESRCSSACCSLTVSGYSSSARGSSTGSAMGTLRPFVGGRRASSTSETASRTAAPCSTPNPTRSGRSTCSPRSGASPSAYGRRPLNACRRHRVE